jgi:predicted transcriptional regulator
MDVDSFLGEKRWEILRIVARSPSSPIELAERLSTTVSYISQQLKLLEAAGLVGKTKTGAAEKGKPRNVYFLEKEFAHVSILTNDVTLKKKIFLSLYNKAVLAILSLENSMLHEPYLRFFNRILDFSKEIKEIYLDFNESKIYIVGSKVLSSKLEKALFDFDVKIKYSLIDESRRDETHILLFHGGERGI